MDMESALRARLLAAAPVAALVGSKVAWIERPQTDALPGITLQIVTDERAQSMTGLDDLQPGYVQIDVWAAKYEQGKAIKEAVIAALMPKASVSGIRFDRGFFSSRDLSERTDTQFIFRPSIDFTFHYANA
ncbi:DUF3168 domain-containing protein [Sphingomonas sp. ZT3P38]|uniref:tail completion protein gp17 n=1 Tax=Parasphingomonas zepuensis TaxID=3096161 RepID=UPI002FC5E9EB